MNAVLKHVLLITSTNLACNPRCLKEVRLLNALHFKITVVAFNLHNWTTEKETIINKELSNVEFIYLETTKHDFFGWIFSSLMEKISLRFSSLLKSNTFLSSMSISKRSWILLKWSKKWKGKTGFIIAHNPPAFYVAAEMAKSLNIPFAIDVEDYHPGEGNNENQKKNVIFLMQQTIAQTAYTSYAAPLIKKYTEAFLPKNTLNGIVINNNFSQSEFLEPVQRNTSNPKLKFVWFSQFIDYGRGLEKVLPALDDFADLIELTLIGNLREPFFEAELKHRQYIKTISSLSQKDLNNELTNHDFGLALEDKEVDMNRNICLTNKIWSYFQAGLFIIASDTEAQQDFILQHQNHGLIISFEADDILQKIKMLIYQLPEIRSKKAIRFEDAKKENWENESSLLINKWNSLLN
jgi:hypothetical protein